MTTTIARPRVLASLVVAGVLGAALAPIAMANPQDADADGATADIVYLDDGRELQGQIVEETDDTIVFELVIPESGIRTKMTLFKSDITSIDRDVAVETPKDGRPVTPVTDPADENRGTFGAHRAGATNENAPAFYLVPMKGQFGTDVTAFVYKEMLDDIRENDPDRIVLVVDCRDYEDKLLYNEIDAPEKSFAGPEMIDNYREIVNFFRDELRDIPQCVWIQDSVGISSAVAFAWEDIYMTPDARLGGVSAAAKRGFDFDSFPDADTIGKMREAYMAFLRGFAEYSDVVPEIIDAMVRAEFRLSGTWEGRTVKWTADTEGQYIVDDDEEATAGFRAKSAEDLCLSTGTAENLDDLALLMGYREYRVIDGAGEKIFDDYVESWRLRLQQAKDLLEEFNEVMSSGVGSRIATLGRAKTILRKIIACLESYEAVEFRFAIETGLTKFDVITQMELIEEEIKGIRRGAGGGGGRGGGAPGGARPGGGG